MCHSMVYFLNSHSEDFVHKACWIQTRLVSSPSTISMVTAHICTLNHSSQTFTSVICWQMCSVNHCFPQRGQLVMKFTKVHRLDFLPISMLKEPNTLSTSSLHLSSSWPGQPGCNSSFSFLALRTLAWPRLAWPRLAWRNWA